MSGVAVAYMEREKSKKVGANSARKRKDRQNTSTSEN